MYLAVFVCYLFFVLLKFDFTTQNQAPVFDPPLESTYFFPEYNATKPGDTLLILSANDPDDDDLEFGVMGEFYNKLLDIKKVDGKHANIVLRQKFDREVQEKYENIVFYVRDPPGNQILQSVRFVITDIDDNAPVFINIPYKVDVSESTSINTIIFESISAYDLDGPLFNEFMFTISEKDANETYFNIQTILVSSGFYNGTVRLSKKLDYEKQKVHLLTITANGINSPFRTTTDMIVNVIDSPDMPPEFSQSPYYVKIPEEMPIGHSVFSVLAKDGDTGVNNPCVYEILYDNSPSAQYFSINKYSGELSIRKRIDRESIEITQMGDLLEFLIVASEVGDESSQSQVTIAVAIIDINDNEPQFDSTHYNLSLTPKTIEGTTLTLLNAESINVHDLDKGINGSFTLSLHSIIETSDGSVAYAEHSKEDFEVIPEKALNFANVNIRVKDALSVNSKIGTLQLYHLRATDNGVNGLVTNVNVFIRIESINQYAPEFEKDLYVFQVMENSLPGTTVDYIHAIDRDADIIRNSIYGQVNYELKNGQNRFDIDKTTGRIFTISKDPHRELDRETIDTFYMSVNAIDGGGLTTSVKIIIKLNDENDNEPEFIYPNNNIFSGLIEENSVKWLEKIELKGFDRDQDFNAALSYEIVDGDIWEKFSVESRSNMIILKDNKTLDFEELYALRNSNMTFDSEDGFDGIGNDEILLSLVVIVKDHGKPQLHSKTIVKIVVKDVNDNSPIFQHKNYSAKVLETATSGDLLYVHAVDLDAPNTLNSKVSYRIASGGKEKFIIDANSGLIRIAPNAQLDPDLYGESYKLEVIANDFGANLAMGNGEMIDENSKCYVFIEIIDVNNKRPEFDSEINSVSVYENLPLNKTILTVRAKDPDKNAEIVYYMHKYLSNQTNHIEAFDEYDRPVNTALVKNWFRVNPKNGIIYAAGMLDREIAERIQFVVYAEDKNASLDYMPQVTSAIVNIRLLDLNDNYPQLLDVAPINKDKLKPPIYKIFGNIAENSKYRTKVTQLKAFDLDLDRNISYVVKNTTGVKRYLSVDEFTGEIYVNDYIDYEVIKWINITIFVYDSGKPERKFSYVFFHCKVDDVNDNVPIFKYINENKETKEIIYDRKQDFVTYGNATVRIKKSLKLSTEILKITATDKDDGLNGEVFYYFDENIGKDNDWKYFRINSNGQLQLNTILNREQQLSYTLDIIASDRGIPQQKSRLTLRIVVVDEFNNAAIFQKKQICYSNIVQCENNYAVILVNFAEEQKNTFISSFHYAKMVDKMKTDNDICYYLIGEDAKYFILNKTTAVLSAKTPFDRETRENYEIIIFATENCACNKNRIRANYSICSSEEFGVDKPYDFNDMSRMKIKVKIDDINDNAPYFEKSVYKIGLTPDVIYGDVILEGLAHDLDSISNLNISINQTSLIKSKFEGDQNTITQEVPFAVEFDETKLSDITNTSYAKFRLKTQAYFKQPTNLKKNSYFFFNITVTDQDQYIGGAQVQVYILNRQQRIKFLFAQPIEKVKEFEDEFKSYIGNLTGYTINVDMIFVHRNGQDGQKYFSTNRAATDMLVHFRDELNLSDEKGVTIVPASQILKILDKSKDATLMKQYKVLLAEQFNKLNTVTFSTEESIFQEYDDSYIYSTPSMANSSQYYNSFLVKITLIIMCILLFITTVVILIVCCLTKQKYERKLRAERAMMKTFGFGAKYNNNGLLNYTGFTNNAFDSTSLSQVPGTNLYTYDGANPMWLKKYDKIETSSSTNTSTCSKADKNLNSPNNTNDGNDDISAFYLKQSCNSTLISHEINKFENNNNSCSPNRTNRADKTLSMTSNESTTADNVCMIKSDISGSTNNTKIGTNNLLSSLSFNSQATQKLNKNKLNTNEQQQQQAKANSDPTNASTEMNIKSDTNITTNTNTNDTSNRSSTSISKDCSDLYVVESTII